MDFRITDDCTGCGFCEAICPARAITSDGDKHVIDADSCISCGICAINCPSLAVAVE